MSETYRSPSKRGQLGVVAVLGLVLALGVLLISGATDAAKGQSEPTASAAQKKKKKKDTVKVLSYNLYLGSDLANPTNAGLASRTDLFADEVGEVLRDVQANDFNVRAQRIAKDIKKQKVDVAGLQEAALWKLEFPTDGGGPPRGTLAVTPLIDYIDTLVNKLNKKAKTKKQCSRIAKKREAQGKKPKPCYRGYKLVVAQQEEDVEQLGDFDNDPGANGRTCDLSSGTCGNPYPSGGGGGGSDDWISGNDDTGQNVGEPPAPQCSDGIDNDGDGRIDFGFDWLGLNAVSLLTSGVPADPDEIKDEYSTPPNAALLPLVTGTIPSPPAPVAGLPLSPAGFNTGPPFDCDSRLDNTETPDSAPLALPQDANMDHHLYSPNFNAPADANLAALIGAGILPPGTPTALPDKFGNGLDPAGVADCARPADPLASPDTSPDPGPTVGADPDGGGPAPPWDAPGFDGALVPVCLFHGIDGDIRLQMRDAILARKGAGVKTRNATGGNFSPASSVKFTLFGTSVNVERGWTAADMNVRGKKFRLVNTHLESENVGTVREDQASELVAPGGPATAPKTVLIGDLNSDPAREPTNLPDGDGGSNIAINRLFAAGFRPVQPPGFSSGHGTAQQDVLNDLSNLLEGRVDHILTNSPSIGFRSGTILDGQIAGLWASDHGGVLSRLKVPGGKKKK